MSSGDRFEQPVFVEALETVRAEALFTHYEGSHVVAELAVRLGSERAVPITGRG